MQYLKFSIGIFLALAASRFIPHPPNFTSLLALSFYIPAILGIRFIPALVVSFFITDLIIGFHSVTFFTWGSVILIGLGSRFFDKSIFNRISGSLLGACLFFIITNFGVWSLGSYGYSLNGIINCYILALPFFGYSLVSTFIFAGVIESVYKYISLKKLIKPNYF
ncbi:MAG: hypothetical protein HOB81_06430 [Flavobacteriaceae bacterium]|jgi:hypothetical protein|nr:hypothetical protein [Flavobacteriaceae bacterium]